MATEEKAVAGGLLSGLGKGLADRGDARSEARRKEAEQMRAAAIEKAQSLRQHEQNLERDEQRNEQRKGLLSRTQADDEGNVYGITRGGDTKDLGINQGVDLDDSDSSGSGSDGADELAGITMSADKKRLYDQMRDKYTDASGQTDWDKLVKHLRGMPESRDGAFWNGVADHLTGGIGTNMSRSEAREQAEQEARQQTGLLTPRSSEFPSTEGDMKAWVDQRTEELMGGGPSGGTTGGDNTAGRAGKADRAGTAGRSAGGSGGGQGKPSQGGQSASKPQGGGTQDDPFKATTQAHIDWFRENAPAGTVIEANGQLYQK